MQLLSPGVLVEARGFSVAVCVSAFVLGALLWLFGWRGHRFWIVLVATVAAGVWGLYSGPTLGTQPVVAGLLLALAAGALALALVRVVAFAAGGLAAWFLLRVLTPGWDDPLVGFLVGGLTALVLFRLCMMALTSLAGTLLMGYSGLCLVHLLGKLDVVAFSERREVLLNGICGGVALVGLVVQFLLDRWRGSHRRRENLGGSQSKKSYEGKSGWNSKLLPYRRAG